MNHPPLEIYQSSTFNRPADKDASSWIDKAAPVALHLLYRSPAIRPQPWGDRLFSSLCDA
jgi:hypothetical protein